MTISDVNFHEMVVAAMCRYPHELRFGQVVDALCIYLLDQPDEICKIVKQASLDMLHSVVDDLVESGDIILREDDSGLYPKRKFHSLRHELLKEGPGYQFMRNHDVPLNYQRKKHAESERVGS